MLYLEDYLEMIEHLPIELRDRFTEMREIDLGVENTVDSLEARQKDFFSRAAGLSVGEREEEYNTIRRDYLKVVEESKEKIQIAEESYGLVDRYLRKLDQELHKFQLELEADNRGITEILEKRSLELDAPSSRPSSYLKENRVPKKLKVTGPPGHTTIAHTVGASGSGARPIAAGSTGAGVGGSGGSGQGQVYSLDQIGASSSAIAQAASQAIAATQLVPGRRSSSLKASYEAINMGVANTEFSIGRELATAANSALAATSTDLSATPSPATPQARVRQHKLKMPKTPGMNSLGLDMMPSGIFDSDMVDTPSMLVDPVLTGQVPTPSPLAPLVSPMAGLSTGAGTPGGQGSDQEWNYDPNEPRYCICNQVSYGDMVACDNEDCPYEWFHYPCVGVTAPPKGKWYCQPCLASMRRRGRK